MHSFENVLSASKGLLVDTMQILSQSESVFVVVGGWCPYLRNETDIKHPGTKDVDILFSDANVKGSLNDTVSMLLEHGFLVSAKHDFQLLKKYHVGDKELIFNIDLLHPSETINNPEMTVDQFDLGITESDLSGNKHVRSMVLPSSQLIFEGFYSDFSITHNNSIGNVTTVNVPLIDEAGLILSKCQSVKVKKRPRDSFDIYLMLAQPNSTEISRKLKESSNQIGPVNQLLIELREFMNETIEDSDLKKFDFNISKTPNCTVDWRNPPSEFVINKLDEILK